LRERIPGHQAWHGESHGIPKREQAMPGVQVHGCRAAEALSSAGRMYFVVHTSRLLEPLAQATIKRRAWRG
jgi:hypothetical protein